MKSSLGRADIVKLRCVVAIVGCAPCDERPDLKAPFGILGVLSLPRPGWESSRQPDEVEDRRGRLTTGKPLIAHRQQ